MITFGRLYEKGHFASDSIDPLDYFRPGAGELEGFKILVESRAICEFKHIYAKRLWWRRPYSFTITKNGEIIDQVSGRADTEEYSVLFYSDYLH